MQRSSVPWLPMLCLSVLAPAGAVYAQVQDACAEGQRALSQGRNAEAARALEACHASTSNLDALLSLGLAQTGMGRPDLAQASYETFVASADATRDAAQLDAVRAELARLREVNAQVELRVRPSETRVRFDGVVLLAHDGRVLVTPGARRIQFDAEGYVALERRLRIDPGLFVLEVALQPLPAAPAVAAAPLSDVEAPPNAESPGPTPATVAAAAVAPVDTQAEPAATTPATPEASDTPPTAPDGPSALDSDAGPCLAGDFCVGPVLSLGIANLLGVGLHARYAFLGLGVDAQFVPELSIAEGKVSAWLVSVPLRVYLLGPFYLSAGFAYQSITGKVSDPSGTVASSIGASALTFGLGILGRSGLVFGIDVQLGITVGDAKTEVSAPADAPDSVISEAQDLANDVADALPVLLQLNVFRIGYLF